MSTPNSDQVSVVRSKPKPDHPFRRHVPSREENERDEWFVVRPYDFSGSVLGCECGRKNNTKL
jgi:hypothetical protein